jgi:hypothetical protein
VAKRKQSPPLEDTLPSALQLDDALPAAEPTPGNAGDLAGFREHVAQLGETHVRKLPWRDPRAEPGEAPAVVAIEIPLAEPGAGYATRHVECRLTVAQADALGRVRSALEATGARVHTAAAGSPRPVQSAADAIRWLLESIASDPGDPGNPGDPKLFLAK